MRLGTFIPGALVRIDATDFKLIRLTSDDEWQLENEETGNLILRPRGQLDEFYVTQRLEFRPRPHERDDKPQPRQTLPMASMNPADEARVRFKDEFLRLMAEREFSNWHSPIETASGRTSAFELALVEVSAKLGRPKPVSRSTYYEWRSDLDLYGDPAEFRRRHGKGRIDQVDQRAKRIILETMRATIEEHCHGRRPAGLKPLKPSEVFTRARNAIKRANAEIGEQNQKGSIAGLALTPLITEPSSSSTWYGYWNSFDAVDRSIVTNGPTETRAAYRGGRGIERPEACLDRVEYDETILPFVCYDEDFGFPYGRAWMSWFYCGVSQLPLSLYLGFEKGSDLALMSALRSACLPKAFLRQQFPWVERSYPVFGIPRLMVFDNGLCQHSLTTQAVTRELRNAQQFAPVVTGWFKAHVEGSFGIINQNMLSTMPGVILPGVSRRDYDPFKHGCIGFRALLQLIWKWIVDVHALAEHTEFHRPRIEVWNESVREFPPSLISRKRDLDELFWVLRAGQFVRNLDHRGVWYEGLRYYSAELHDLRRAFGDKQTVQIRVNPADLGLILVRPSDEIPWCRVEAVDFAYANGRSLKQHKFCRKIARSRFSQDDLNAWLLAQQSFAELLAEIVSTRAPISSASTAAALLGIGSQHLTARLDHDGHIMADRVQVLAAPTATPGPHPAMRPQSDPGADEIPQFASGLDLLEPKA